MISDEFNDFFVNIGPQLASTIKTDGKQYYDYLKTPMTFCMFLKPVVEEEDIKSFTNSTKIKVPAMMILETL